MGASLVQTRRIEPAVLAKVAGFVWLLHLGLGALLVTAAPLAGWVFADARLPPLFQVAALQFVFIALGAVPQALASRALHFSRSGSSCHRGESDPIDHAHHLPPGALRQSRLRDPLSATTGCPAERPPG
jgi:hypothetical protein